MHWIAPSEKDSASATLERRLWDTADQFRANPSLKAQEYSGPIHGLIFLRFAEVRFDAHRSRLENIGPIENLRQTRDLLLSEQVELITD